MNVTTTATLNLQHANLLFQFHHLRPYYKRRRFKPPVTRTRAFVTCSLLDPFQNFLSQFPSQTTLDFLAPALALASGLSLFYSQFKSALPSLPSSTSAYVGDWIFFTSPTPFNRFVLLRCPSVSFEGSELLEHVNDKLVKEERHFVRLNSGKIVHERKENGGLEEELEYQRVCVNTEDGAVVSLDWPANLELEEEHGLDTTLLLVPGTAEGSMEENVRVFVVEALKHGFFPVVMNPRGCAGSPVTTPRLFTAADSDDISTAVQFVNKARPWTTLMGVGWGYGANMLTKYLAEVGERTPLTAATCINNPFDLEEATRCSPDHFTLDKKLASGLIDILQANKELFKGRAKGFDVEKALSAKSVRDFEKAISMVSYGFKEVEEFYSRSSTRNMVAGVKIPVLFIQNDDGTVPLFSIPRSLIAENPFTSLLLCSCVPFGVIASSRAAMSWCQNLTIEWLTAVELGLLKGRHPLLKDVDVNINPSKGSSLMKGRTSDKDVQVDRVLDLTLTDANKGIAEPGSVIFEGSNDVARLPLRSRRDSHGNLELKGGVEVENDALQRTSSVGTDENQATSVDAELVEQGIVDPTDNETGQMLQTAQVVMNMLDVSMPGILPEGKKKKVLIAVSQGETLMKALQDAVPEEVRGKLTTAVSGILHAQRTNFKFDGLLGIGKIPSVSSGVKSKIQDKVRDASSAEGMPENPNSLDQRKRAADDLGDGSGNNQPGPDRSGAAIGQELHASDNAKKSADLSQSQPTSTDNSASVRKGTNESINSHESDEFIKEKAASYSDSSEKVLETSANPNLPKRSEKAGGTDESTVDESKVDQDGGISQLETKRENNTQKNEEKAVDSSTDQNKMASATVTETTASPSGSSPDSQPMEKEGSDDQKEENKSMQPSSDQNKLTTPDSSLSTFNVVQALDALTGMDDSTQVAVNSVFGVIEDMISHLEEEKDDGNKIKERNEIQDKSIDSSSKKQHVNPGCPLEMPDNGENKLAVQSDSSCNSHVDDQHGNDVNLQDEAGARCVADETSENPILFKGSGNNASQGSTPGGNKSKEKPKHNQSVGRRILVDYGDRSEDNIPLYITVNPYGDYLHKEYFRRYLLSKIPNTKPLDLDTTTALLLDYFPEDGQWKLLEQPGNIGESTGIGVDGNVHVHEYEEDDTDDYIEPSYVVLDGENQQEPVSEYDSESFTGTVDNGDDGLEEMKQSVKGIMLDALRIEVGRKLSTTDMKQIKSELDGDLEQVANAVSLTVECSKDHTRCLQGTDCSSAPSSKKVGTLSAEHVIRAISSAVQGTSCLRKLMPVGVIIGSSLAALRKYFNVATEHEDGLTSPDQTKISEVKNQEKISIKEVHQKSTIQTHHATSFNNTRSKEGNKAALQNINKDSVVVGAVTAALGASALLVQRQNPSKDEENEDGSSKSFKEGGSNQKVTGKFDEQLSEKHQNNIVTSLAEKAMSVAGPVVPTKEDGEVDQERLVAMLADLGQKGGILRLVGKIALLWGGIRGAMSLTDRLILFLHIAERPLYQRILGFVGMVLVLWSPVIVPLLPMLVQSWTTGHPSKFAELVCIVGLYTAVMILVMLWGKRIRGYEDPLEEYGLDLMTLPKIRSFLKGLVGGVILVLSIQSVNALLGCASFSLPLILPSSSLDIMTCLKAYGQMIILAVRGIITATSVVLVEELLFRSWLPEEAAADLGYHQGIIISGLAFSLFQRSLWAIPGLWLFSLALAGLRQRNQGSLSIPIGLRTGVTASSFVLQTGGFLIYNPRFPLWATGTHPFQPFSGIVGFAVALLLAIILYPRKPLQKKI